MEEVALFVFFVLIGYALWRGVRRRRVLRERRRRSTVLETLGASTTYAYPVLCCGQDNEYWLVPTGAVVNPATTRVIIPAHPVVVDLPLPCRMWFGAPNDVDRKKIAIIIWFYVTLNLQRTSLHTYHWSVNSDGGVDAVHEKIATAALSAWHARERTVEFAQFSNINKDAMAKERCVAALRDILERAIGYYGYGVADVRVTVVRVGSGDQPSSHETVQA